MASMPSRIESLRIALPGIMAQVDRLYLYLDQYRFVPPEFASDSRIVPLLPRDEDPSLRGAGKFFGLSQFSAPCLYFCFDDDIAYPAGYVDHLAAALARHRFRTLIGLRRAHPELGGRATTQVLNRGYPFAYLRGGTHLVIVNPRQEPASVALDRMAGARLLLGEGAAIDGSVVTVAGFGFGVWEQRAP